MLSIDNIHIRYGGISAVEGATINVERGETVLLLGANGAGKSSIINAVMGLVRPSAGAIFLDGQRIDLRAPESRGVLGVAFSPEGRRLFSTMTVEENVHCGMYRRDVQERAKRYEELARMFPLLDEKRSVPGGLLSGGQQQIVAVARSMAARPRLLLLDEPFLGLAPVWIHQISAAIREARDEGATILMAEQMARPALKVADRAYVIRSGQIRLNAAASELGESDLTDQYL